MQSDKEILQKILTELNEIKESYTNLEKKVDEMYKNTKRMEEHIDFVENTYDTVKTPFHYLMDKVSLFSFSSFIKSEISQCKNQKLENKESENKESENKESENKESENKESENKESENINN